MSLLSDPNLMNDQFFPEGYNVFTGVVDRSHSVNDKYGEVHTGEAWISARNRYCTDKTDMPVELIVFADNCTSILSYVGIKLCGRGMSHI